MSKKQYKSDILLGERYRDAQTGFEGVATSTTFFQHACERVGLESYDATQQQVRVEIFDAPRLIRIATGVQASSTKTGGDRDTPLQRGSNAR